MNFCTISWIVSLASIPLLFAGRANAEPADAAGFKEVAQPYFAQYCVKCHGAEKTKGNLRLDTITNNFADAVVMAQWKEVVEAVDGHNMPPKESTQPNAQVATKFAEWVSKELSSAELAKRATRVVFRRLNRSEYNNTIRDLVGVDFQPASTFPEDPPAGGFDNIGQALSVSPLQIELYYAAAHSILDRALFEGPKPKGIKWTFEPEENTMGTDSLRVNRDGNRILLNHGENEIAKGMTIIHHDSWNTGVDFRDFKVPADGEYLLRVVAAGRTPSRKKVVDSARAILNVEKEKQDAMNPARKAENQKRLDEQLRHFETSRMYNYGPPRMRISQTLAGTPLPIAEMDVDAPESKPKSYEVKTYLRAVTAGIDLQYSYEIPRSDINWTMLGNTKFARPLLMIDRLELEGPVHPVWPPESHSRILFDSPYKEKDEKAYAREVIGRFMTRAYRRPVTPAEIDSKLALFVKLRANKPSFIQAIKPPLAAILSSTHFLYLVEPGQAEATPRPLTQFELASRLSYFLWSSMPDNELTALATRSVLNSPEVLRQQVSRMLKDAKSEALIKNFAGQWLGLRKVGANPPAKNIYPEYDRHLEISMVLETERFFAEILHTDLDARSFIKSDFVMINERLARFYGIDGVKGDAIRKVAAPPDSHRGGLVTQASIHSITSNGTRTSPVSRGVWVMKTLLGTDPGIPTANVGEIPSKIPGFENTTLRQKLELHRQNVSCARCHDKIDPLGIALENFNACGEWRDHEPQGNNGRSTRNDPTINVTAKLPDGTEFSGVEGLQTQLLKQEDLFLKGLAGKLMTYALGRELGYSDRPTIDTSVATMKKANYTMRSLLVEIVVSQQFTTK